jgi:hypothetical protein
MPQKYATIAVYIGGQKHELDQIQKGGGILLFTGMRPRRLVYIYIFSKLIEW